MSSKAPSLRERQVLTLIHRHLNEHGEPPSHKWLAKELLRLIYPDTNIKESKDTSKWLKQESSLAYKNVLTILGRLEIKGYVERQGSRPRLTDKSKEYFARLYESASLIKSFDVLPTQLKVMGNVRAGRQSEYDLAVDMPASNIDPITIPDTRPDRKIYALKVEGSSMEHEGIFEGDYVIIEEFSQSDWPRDGDMIVTKYLEIPEYLKNDPEIDLNDFELSGHTLKVYKEVREKDDQYYRLSWKKDHQSNPHLIKAVRLEPIGRIIGVYRSLRR